MESRNLNDILFPLEFRDIYTKINGDKYVKIPGKKLLINANDQTPISIVSNGYELVTNQEAYNNGIKCMRTLFNLSDRDNIELFNITFPSTKSFCHIDLFCDKDKFICVKERHQPFLRVTNSYNGMFKLTFSVGFCRWICQNGVIFGRDAIKFSYIHEKGLNHKINFNIHKEKFSEILNKYKNGLEILKENSLSEQYSFALFCKALRLKFDTSSSDEKNREKVITKLNNFKRYFRDKLTSYKNDCGITFYALFNVITDASTHGFKNDNRVITKLNSKQSCAGRWLTQISGMLRKGGIDYDSYLGE